MLPAYLTHIHTHTATSAHTCARVPRPVDNTAAAAGILHNFFLYTYTYMLGIWRKCKCTECGVRTGTEKYATLFSPALLKFSQGARGT